MALGGVALEQLAWEACVGEVDAQEEEGDGAGYVVEGLEGEALQPCAACAVSVWYTGVKQREVLCKTCRRAQERIEQARRPATALHCAQCSRATCKGAHAEDATGKWYCLSCWRVWERGQDRSFVFRAACTASNVRQHATLRRAAKELMQSWTFQAHSSGSCSLCGSQPSALTLGSDGRALCSRCWVQRDGGEDAFLAFAKKIGAWPSLEELFNLLSGPQESHHKLMATRHPPLAGQAVVIVWDVLDALCACFARALWCDFRELCRFVERHEVEAVAEAFASFPESHRDDLCAPGKVAALLPSGVLVADCQRHQRILLYELQYALSVRSPSVESRLALEREYLAPLAALRGQARGDFERWWTSPEVLERVGRSLQEQCFAVLDGFLEEREMRELRADAQQLFVTGRMLRGSEEQGGSYWGDDIANEFTNAQGIPMKWNAFGNHKVFISDHDPSCPGVAHLPRATDELLSRLKGVVKHGALLPPRLVERLQPADLREHVMVASYRGGDRGRYIRHTDIGRNAVLTMLYYCNDGWTEEDGGQLRLYHPGHSNLQVRYDVLPLGNRLLLFWSNQDAPHEVLPTRKDRYAMTVWYRAADDIVSGQQGQRGGQCGGESGVQNLLRHLHPVAPLTVKDALLRAGVDEETAQRVDLVYRFHTETRGSKDDGALATYLRQFGF